MKKTKLLATAAMLLCLTAGATACNFVQFPSGGTTTSSSQTEKPSSSDNGSGEVYEDETTKISLDEERISLSENESRKLTATTKNFKGNVLWSTTDPSVATVKDGVVTAVGAGEAVIMATANGVTAMCTVSVTPAAEIPAVTLSHSTVELYTGKSFTVTANTTWQGKDVENVVYAVSNGNEEIATLIEKESGTFVVKGLQAGETEYTVSARAMDTTVYATLKIRVVNAVYGIAFDQFTAVEGGYAYTMERNEKDEEVKETFTYSVTLGGDRIENASVSFESNKTDVLSIDEDGAFVAKAEGEAVVTVTVSGEDFETFTVSVTITVKEVRYHTVTYYDENGDCLYTEEVREGNAAPVHEATTLPQGRTDGDYTITYTEGVWALENGALADAAMQNVTGDLNVYRKYSYEASVSHSYTRAEGDAGAIAWSGKVAEANKYAQVEGDKFVLRFKTSTADQAVYVAIGCGADNVVAKYLKQNTMYTATIEFDSKGYGKSFTLVDESGESTALSEDQKAAVKKFTKENLLFEVRYPVTAWSDPIVYGDAVEIEVVAVVSGAVAEKVQQKYDVKYYDENGELLHTEEVTEGESATYAYAGKALENGYTEQYTNVAWVTEQGGETIADLSAVSGNTSVYLKLSGEKLTSKRYDLTKDAAGGGWAINTAVKNLNENIALKDGKVEFWVRSQDDDVLVQVMETVQWLSNGVELKKGEWYRYSFTFADGHATSFVVYTSDGNVAKEVSGVEANYTAVSDYTPDNLQLLVKTQRLDWNGNYAATGVIEIAAVKAETSTPEPEPTPTPDPEPETKYTVTYYDENGEVLSTESVKEGKSATFGANGEIVLSDGYTQCYSDLKWMTEQGGSTEADLSAVQANTSVYISGTKTMCYIKANAYDKVGAYPLLASLNKYAVADENGNITFKIRLNGSTGAAFSLYEKQTWNENNYGVWLEDTDWYTVTINGATKHIVVTDKNGNIWNGYDADIAWYTPETLSIVLNCDMDIAA